MQHNNSSVLFHDGGEEEDDEQTGLIPVPVFRRFLWLDDTECLMEYMQNTLYSRRLQMMWVWFPKCMCTTLRDLFIKIQIILNPNMLNENINLNIHRLHRRKRFRFVEMSQTPLQHMLMIVRDPMHRFFSTFFDKHVMKRQWHYLNLHNYRKFRIWLDVENLQHSMATYLQFIASHHFIDVHDLPMIYQMPFHLWRESDKTHGFSMEDPQWKSKFEQKIMEIVTIENVPAARRKLIKDTIQQTLQHTHRNALPHAPHSHPVFNRPLDTQSISWWVAASKQFGFPPYSRLLHHNPQFAQTLQTLYYDDLVFYHNHRRLSSTPLGACDSNIWSHQQ